MTTIETLSTEHTPRQLANRWRTLVICIGVVVLGLIVAPVIFIAIYGLVGLTLALAIAAVVTLVGWATLPWLGTVAANWKLKLLKQEAAHNPVETMQTNFSAASNFSSNSNRRSSSSAARSKPSRTKSAI